MSLSAYPRIGDWLTVEGDRLVVHTGKVDIGQRISTALTRIVCEELTLSPDAVGLAPVRTGGAPDEGVTSGSNSIEQSGHAVRHAAATLRALVLARAAEQFGGAPADWTLADGLISGRHANEPVHLLDIADGIDLGQNVDLAVEIGAGSSQSVPMRGLAEMVTGRFTFLHDLDVPGMWHARVVRPPHARARLDTIDPAALDRLSDAGLQLVRDGSFLAIAGADEWPVIKAAERFAAACRWSEPDKLPEDDVFARLTQANAQRFVLVDCTPTDAAIAPAPTAPDFAARYERPFTLHGALAPSAAMAVWTDGILTIQTHSQGIYPLRNSIADSLDLPLDQVVLIHTPGSGCYGHNGADDAAFEAALVAMAIPGTPVLLKWTRAEEHAWEPFGPPMAVELAATLDNGRIAAFSGEAIGGTFGGRPRPGPGRAGPARLLANRLRETPVAPRPAAPNLTRHGGIHRNLDPIYDFPDKRLVKTLVDDLPHRTSALRCLGAAANVFALESFMDEIARDHGRDPFAFRLDHMVDARGQAVLQRLQHHAGDGRADGRGIAYAQYKNAMTRVGVCVDLDVSNAAEIRPRHAMIVADAGREIDPDGLRAQLEGGFIQAASWALCEEVTWDRDGITSRDWESYPVLRFDQVPTIEIDILSTAGDPSVGAGEASPGPTLAAIANALFDATGLRMRRLPFTPDAMRRQAMSGETS